MQNKFELKVLVGLVPGLGLLAMVLRRILYGVGPDHKNLLPVGHPLEIALWVLTLAVIALVLWRVRHVGNLGTYGRHYPRPMLNAVGCAVLAIGLGLTLFLGRDGVARVDRILGTLAAAGLATVCVCRCQVKRPNYVFHGAVCIFFAFHLISRYKTWSGNPQIQDYVYTMLSCVGLMLFAYQQAAFDAGYGQRKHQLAVGLVTVFCCITALSGTENPLLYASGALWVLTNLSSLREPRPEPPQEVTANDPA